MLKKKKEYLPISSIFLLFMSFTVKWGREAKIKPQKLVRKLLFQSKNKKI